MRAELRERYLFYETQLRGNIPGYVKEFLPYIVLLIIAAFADFVSTYRFMSEGSVDDEFNPLIRLIAQMFGPFFGPLIGKTGQVLAIVFVTLLFRPLARIIFIPITVAYFHAAWYNTWGIYLYTPRFIDWFS